MCRYLNDAINIYIVFLLPNILNCICLGPSEILFLTKEKAQDTDD
jgi:hypothetical protein